MSTRLLSFSVFQQFSTFRLISSNFVESDILFGLCSIVLSNCYQFNWFYYCIENGTVRNVLSDLCHIVRHTATGSMVQCGNEGIHIYESIISFFNHLIDVVCPQIAGERKQQLSPMCVAISCDIVCIRILWRNYIEFCITDAMFCTIHVLILAEISFESPWNIVDSISFDRQWRLWQIIQLFILNQRIPVCHRAISSNLIPLWNICQISCHISPITTNAIVEPIKKNEKNAHTQRDYREEKNMTWLPIARKKSLHCT